MFFFPFTCIHHGRKRGIDKLHKVPLLSRSFSKYEGKAKFRYDIQLGMMLFNSGSSKNIKKKDQPILQRHRSVFYTAPREKSAGKNMPHLKLLH